MYEAEILPQFFARFVYKLSEIEARLKMNMTFHYRYGARTQSI